MGQPFILMGISVKITLRVITSTKMWSIVNMVQEIRKECWHEIF